VAETGFEGPARREVGESAEAEAEDGDEDERLRRRWRWSAAVVVVGKREEWESRRERVRVAVVVAVVVAVGIRVRVVVDTARRREVRIMVGWLGSERTWCFARWEGDLKVEVRTQVGRWGKPS
jgi:hypothetical protein